MERDKAGARWSALPLHSPEREGGQVSDHAGVLRLRGAGRDRGSHAPRVRGGGEVRMGGVMGLRGVSVEKGGFR